MTAHLIIVTVARQQFNEYPDKSSLFFSMYISFLNLIVFAGHAAVFMHCIRLFLLAF